MSVRCNGPHRTTSRARPRPIAISGDPGSPHEGPNPPEIGRSGRSRRIRRTAPDAPIWARLPRPARRCSVAAFCADRRSADRQIWAVGCGDLAATRAPLIRSGNARWDKGLSIFDRPKGEGDDDGAGGRGDLWPTAEVSLHGAASRGPPRGGHRRRTRPHRRRCRWASCGRTSTGFRRRRTRPGRWDRRRAGRTRSTRRWRT